MTTHSPRQDVPVEIHSELHKYMFTRSTHVAPASHGLLAHSSMFAENKIKYSVAISTAESSIY